MNDQSPGTRGPASLLRHGADPLVIGHRGASSQAPENTLPAFRTCWTSGVHWIETDVQPTADLVPVLFHDVTLERTSTGSGALRDRRLAELVHLDVGSWFGRPELDVIGLPTLHELLSALPPAGQVLLEIKGPHSAAELMTELAVIRGTHTHDRVWLQSFEVEVLMELQAAVPHGWRALLRDEMDADPVGLCRDLGVSSYHPQVDALLAAPAAVDELHAAGISVVVWTSNDETEWERLSALQVDGIITDRPVELRERQLRAARADLDSTG